MRKEKKRKRVLGNSKAENKVFTALIQDLSWVFWIWFQRLIWNPISIQGRGTSKRPCCRRVRVHGGHHDAWQRCAWPECELATLAILAIPGDGGRFKKKSNPIEHVQVCFQKAIQTSGCFTVSLSSFLPDVQGLAVFCVVPTTLSSGVTMVTQAKAAAQTKRSHEDTKGPAISSADRASFPWVFEHDFNHFNRSDRPWNLCEFVLVLWSGILTGKCLLGSPSHYHHQSSWRLSCKSVEDVCSIFQRRRFRVKPVT